MIAKIKKIVIKSLLALLISSALLTTFASANVAYAVHSCPPDWTPEETNKCFKEGVSETCPGGYVPFSNEGGTMCLKAISPDPSSMQDLIKRANVLLSVQSFLNRLIWPVLVMIGELMGNDLLFGSGMEEHLRDIWIPIRNLVNILFVIVLVGIALYNVLGIGDENSEYSIKSVLPKIIIGIIAVNFSFLAIKVFLDVINVLTVSVFSLPGQVSSGLEQIVNPEDEDDKELLAKFCKQLSGRTSAEFAGGDQLLEQQDELMLYKAVAGKNDYLGSSLIPTANKAEINNAVQDLGPDKKAAFDQEIQASLNKQICYGTDLTPVGKQFLKRWNSHNAALAMALSMGKIVFYEDIDPINSSTTEKLIINTLFSVLLYLVYVASFLAMFAVLLARLVVLWLGIAISPILLLMMAAPTLKDKLGSFGEIAQKFTKNAIAPLLMALAMTVGWIMLKAVQDLNITGQQGSFQVAVTNGIPVVGLSTIQDLIVALGTVGVVWLGVFSAAEGTLAEFATNGMRDFLTNAGKWVGSLPFKHIPFVPIKIPGAEGAYTGAQVWEAMKAGFEPGRTEKDLKLVTALGLKGASDPSEIKNADTKDEVLRGVARASEAGKMEGAAYQEALREYQTNHSNDFIELDKADKFNGALQALIDAPDDAARKKAAKEIKRKIADNPALKGGLPATATGKPSAPGTAPPPPPAGQQVDRNTDLGNGRTVGSIPEVTDTHISKFNRDLNQLRTQLQTLRQTTPDGSKISDPNVRNRVRDMLKQIKIRGQVPTREALQKLVGAEGYQYLTTMLGETDGSLAAFPSATPPAGGAAGGVGTAGAPPAPPAPPTPPPAGGTP